jgi:uncharacterized protein YjbI with pentapeptide repeats
VRLDSYICPSSPFRLDAILTVDALILGIEARLARLAEARLAEARLAEALLAEARLAEARLAEARLAEARLEDRLILAPPERFSGE